MVCFGQLPVTKSQLLQRLRLVKRTVPATHVLGAVQVKALQAGQEAQRRMDAKAAEREAQAKARRHKQEASKAKVREGAHCSESGTAARWQCVAMLAWQIAPRLDGERLVVGSVQIGCCLHACTAGAAGSRRAGHAQSAQARHCMAA